MSVTERASVVQDVAAELLADTPQLAREMADHLHAAIPELAALEDDEVMAELVAARRRTSAKCSGCSSAEPASTR
jgi:hypothetical protein